MLEFTKMTGIGNDYIYINCIDRELNTNPSKLAEKMSDRNFGVGSDGLVLIKRGQQADYYMEMYNSDGSQSPMCGNALRCIAKYLYDKNITKDKTINIETASGVYKAILFIENNKVHEVEIDMGSPSFSPKNIPIIGFNSPVLNKDIEILNHKLQFSAVSIGNPHCVIFLSKNIDMKNYPVKEIGPLIEHHEYFPEKTNVEFVQLISSNEVIQRTWERGSGETLACGSGASAVLAVGVSLKMLEHKVLIHLRGGDLKLTWDNDLQHIIQRGTATFVFEGTWIDN